MSSGFGLSNNKNSLFQSFYTSSSETMFYSADVGQVLVGINAATVSQLLEERDLMKASFFSGFFFRE